MLTSLLPPRIHSYRGVRHVTLTLDSHVIFKGEVARACGGLAGGTEAYGDTILFTEQEDILENVAAFDLTYQVRHGFTYQGCIFFILKCKLYSNT